MKRLLFLAIISLAVASCNEKPDTVTISKDDYDKLRGVRQAPKPEYPKEIVINDVDGNYFYPGDKSTQHVLLIDSCEYIFIERAGDGGPALAHKGNCKFCAERMKNLLIEIKQHY